MTTMVPPASVDEFTRATATDALALAKDVQRDQQGHEDLCAERYKNIGREIVGLREEINGLRGIFKWAGGALFTLLLAAFGFLINQTVTANNALTERNNAAQIAATRIEILQDALVKERQRHIQPVTPQP